jgi:hypothetical protein
MDKFGQATHNAKNVPNHNPDATHEPWKRGKAGSRSIEKEWGE